MQPIKKCIVTVLEATNARTTVLVSLEDWRDPREDMQIADDH